MPPRKEVLALLVLVSEIKFNGVGETRSNPL